MLYEVTLFIFIFQMKHEQKKTKNMNNSYLKIKKNISNRMISVNILE